MITKAEWIAKVSKVEQTFEDEFKAEFNSPELLWPVIQRLLQQAPCSSLRELLVQKLNKATDERDRWKEGTELRRKTNAIVETLCDVIELIDNPQPVA